jgi:hypothetical protein
VLANVGKISKIRRKFVRVEKIPPPPILILVVADQTATMAIGEKYPLVPLNIFFI